MAAPAARSILAACKTVNGTAVGIGIGAIAGNAKAEAIAGTAIDISGHRRGHRQALTRRGAVGLDAPQKRRPLTDALWLCPGAGR